MARRLSTALVGLGALGGLIWLAAVSRQMGQPGGLGTLSADLDGLIREAAAGVKARADTLAQMPRLGWAVATDEATVRDLTSDELAFRPQPGENIEIAQVRRSLGKVRSLLRLSADTALELPMASPGTHVVTSGGRIHIVAVVPIEARERASELTGAIAVARVLDVSPIAERLNAAKVGARLRTAQGAVTLGIIEPNEQQVTSTTLTGSAAGATLLVSGGRRPSPLRFGGPFVLLAISLTGGTVLWRRGAVRHTPVAAIVALTPTLRALPPVEPQPSEDVDLDATPMARAADLGLRVDMPPKKVASFRTQTGSVRLPDSLRFAGTPRNGTSAVPSAPDNDPLTVEFRSLFSEYVDLRRTCGEPVDNLEADRFVEALRQERDNLIQKLAVQDVRFRLAFDNGKAAIRFKTVA